MYGKIFKDIFDSTLANYGADTIYVMVAMVVKSDAQGYLRITPEALARSILKDTETVQIAIENLETIDPDSNDPDYEGRRIIALSNLTGGIENRGWWVVNKEKYILKANPDDRKRQNREAQQRKRDRIKQHQQTSASISKRQQASSSVSKHVQTYATSAHKDKDKDKYINKNAYLNTPTPMDNASKTENSYGGHENESKTKRVTQELENIENEFIQPK